MWVNKQLGVSWGFPEGHFGEGTKRLPRRPGAGGLVVPAGLGGRVAPRRPLPGTWSSVWAGMPLSPPNSLRGGGGAADVPTTGEACWWTDVVMLLAGTPGCLEGGNPPGGGLSTNTGRDVPDDITRGVNFTP